MPTRTFRIGWFCAALALLVSCGGEPETPEDQVRALIQRATAAAEDKSIGKLREMISDRYADAHQQDKRGIEALLRFHFLRNKTIHLFTRIPNVTLTDPDHAQATVLVAMGGVPIPSADDLPALRADLHHFEIELAREEDQWRVTRAAWRRAEPAEFMNP